MANSGSEEKSLLGEFLKWKLLCLSQNATTDIRIYVSDKIEPCKLCEESLVVGVVGGWGVGKTTLIKNLSGSKSSASDNFYFFEFNAWTKSAPETFERDFLVWMADEIAKVLEEKQKRLKGMLGGSEEKNEGAEDIEKRIGEIKKYKNFAAGKRRTEKQINERLKKNRYSVIFVLFIVFFFISFVGGSWLFADKFASSGLMVLALLLGFFFGLEIWSVRLENDAKDQKARNKRVTERLYDTIKNLLINRKKRIELLLEVLLLVFLIWWILKDYTNWRLQYEVFLVLSKLLLVFIVGATFGLVAYDEFGVDKSEVEPNGDKGDRKNEDASLLEGLMRVNTRVEIETEKYEVESATDFKELFKKMIELLKSEKEQAGKSDRATLVIAVEDMDRFSKGELENILSKLRLYTSIVKDENGEGSGGIRIVFIVELNAVYLTQRLEKEPEYLLKLFDVIFMLTSRPFASILENLRANIVVSEEEKDIPLPGEFLEAWGAVLRYLSDINVDGLHPYISFRYARKLLNQAVWISRLRSVERSSSERVSHEGRQSDSEALFSKLSFIRVLFSEGIEKGDRSVLSHIRETFLKALILNEGESSGLDAARGRNLIRRLAVALASALSLHKGALDVSEISDFADFVLQMHSQGRIFVGLSRREMVDVLLELVDLMLAMGSKWSSLVDDIFHYLINVRIFVAEKEVELVIRKRLLVSEGTSLSEGQKSRLQEIGNRVAEYFKSGSDGQEDAVLRFFRKLLDKWLDQNEKISESPGVRNVSLELFKALARFADAYREFGLEYVIRDLMDRGPKATEFILYLTLAGLDAGVLDPSSVDHLFRNKLLTGRAGFAGESLLGDETFWKLLLRYGGEMRELLRIEQSVRFETSSSFMSVFVKR